ncbi:MAG: DUF4123 domain-containing protein [Bryobacterales bacterium]|nr:DUF4123 domain-containing protein [Bryobacterales bacterium]
MKKHRYLHTATGPYSGRKIALRPRQPATIGRSHEAAYAFFTDQHMSRVHASAALSVTGCVVRDLNSTNGVFVDGQRVDRQIFLQPGQQVRIAETVFLLADSPIPVEEILKPAPLTPAQQQWQQALLAGPLYAVLDAAQSDRIVPLLQDSHLQYQSLYEGPAAEKLGNVAPFLVHIPEPCPFLSAAIAEGWDKAWGIFLHCDLSFPLVRKHLRHFLTVETEGGNKLLFRFYDPRILAAFLPTCDRLQEEEFFGPVTKFLTQDEGAWAIHTKLEGGQAGDQSGGRHVSHTEPANTGSWSSPSADKAAAVDDDPDRTRVHRSRGNS